MTPQPPSIVARLPWIIAFVFLAAIEWVVIDADGTKRDKTEADMRLQNRALRFAEVLLLFILHQHDSRRSRRRTTKQRQIVILLASRYGKCRGETPILAASVGAYFPAIRRCSMRG